MRGRCCLYIVLSLGLALILGIFVFNRLLGGATPTMPQQADVPADIPAYDRSEWGDWIDANNNCRNTRHEVLAEESTEPVSYRSDRQCRVASGRWVGPYTGQTFIDPSSLDVDHVVPLAHAHRSGAWAWDRDRKLDYYNDLDNSGHLAVVERTVNREKGSQGPEHWKPPNQANWCEYAGNWISVKAKWELTATAAEIAALETMLETCPN